MAAEAVFYAFDLLYLDGHDLTHMDQRDRRELLSGLLEDTKGTIKLLNLSGRMEVKELKQIGACKELARADLNRGD